MAGLDPATHVFLVSMYQDTLQVVATRDKLGHDQCGCVAAVVHDPT
jgi:hypothetical protein